MTMQTRSGLFACALALLSAASLPVFAQDPVAPQMQITKPVYPWKTEAQKQKDGKTFSHCIVKNMYDNGILVLLAENSSHHRRLALHFPQDKISPKTSYPLEWQVDRQDKQTVNAVGVTPRILAIALDDAMTQQIARGNMLFLRGPNDTLIFDMNGMGAATQSLADCLATNGIAPGSVTFKQTDAKPDDKGVSTPTPAVPVQAGSDKNAKTSAKTPSLSFRQLFARAGMTPQNPIAVPDADRADKPFDWLWTDGPLFFGVKSEPAIPHQALAQTASRFTGILQQICGGQFLAEGGKVEKRGNTYVMPAEVACSPQAANGKAGQSTVAALLFVLDTTALQIVFVEAPSNLGTKAVQTRDRLLEKIN